MPGLAIPVETPMRPRPIEPSASSRPVAETEIRRALALAVVSPPSSFYDGRSAVSALCNAGWFSARSLCTRSNRNGGFSERKGCPCPQFPHLAGSRQAHYSAPEESLILKGKLCLTTGDGATTQEVFFDGMHGNRSGIGSGKRDWGKP